MLCPGIGCALATPLVIGCSTDWMDMEKAVDLSQEVGRKVAALVCEDLTGYSYSGKDLNQLFRHPLCINGFHGDCLWVACGVVTHNQDVFMPSPAAGKRPHNIHSYPCKWLSNHW